MINIDQFQLIIKENIIFDTSDKKYSIMPISKKWKKWLFDLFFWKVTFFRFWHLRYLITEMSKMSFFKFIWEILNRIVCQKIRDTTAKILLKKIYNANIFFWVFGHFFTFSEIGIIEYLITDMSKIRFFLIITYTWFIHVQQLKKHKFWTYLWWDIL